MMVESRDSKVDELSEAGSIVLESLPPRIAALESDLRERLSDGWVVSLRRRPGQPLVWAVFVNHPEKQLAIVDWWDEREGGDAVGVIVNRVNYQFEKYLDELTQPFRVR